MAKSIKERFWRFVDSSGECWLWTGSKNPGGYGQFAVRTPDGWRPARAHRVAYELWIGPIPPGLQLDHLCRNRACVNPDHLEPVTQQENIRRGAGPSAVNALKTHCKRGHEFTPENTYYQADGGRMCRECARRMKRLLWAAANRQVPRGASRNGRTRVLLAVVREYQANGSASLSAVARRANLRPPATHRHLAKLRAEGLVDWTDGVRGTIRPLVTEVVLTGRTLTDEERAARDAHTAAVVNKLLDFHGDGR